MSLSRIIFDSGKILILIVFIVGLFHYRKFSIGMRYVFYFVLLGGISEISVILYKAHIEQNTMPIGHLYFTLSITILCFYYLCVLKGYVSKWITHSIVVGFATFAIVNPILIQSLQDYPNLLGAMGAIILVIFSILLFSRIISEAKIVKLRDDPMIWINSAVLFFYSGSFFYNILFNQIVDYSIEFAKLMTQLYAVFNIIFYGLIGIGFLKVRKQTA